MPDLTLEQQLNAFVAAGNKPADVVAKFKEQIGAPIHMFRMDTPMSAIGDKSKWGSYLSPQGEALYRGIGGPIANTSTPVPTTPTASVLPKTPIQPTLEQQGLTGGKPVPVGTVANPLTGEPTPTGSTAPQAVDNVLTQDTATPRPKYDRQMPQLEGGLLNFANPKEILHEVTDHIMPALKAAGTMSSVEVPRTRGRGGPMTGQGGEVSPEAYRTTPSHAVSEAYKASKEDLDERGRTNPIWNTITDAGDFVLSPLQLASEVMLPKVVTAKQSLKEQGHEFGENIAGGLVGGISAQLDNPAAMLYGRPLSTAAALAPVLGAAFKGAPALARGLGKLHPGLGEALAADVDLGGTAGKITRGLGNAFTEQRALSNYGHTLGPNGERIPGTPLDMEAMDAARKQMAADVAKAQKIAADKNQGITNITNSVEREMRDKAMKPVHGKSFKASQDELAAQIKELWEGHERDKQSLDNELKTAETGATAAYDEATKRLKAASTPDTYKLKPDAGLGDLAAKVSEWLGKHVKKPSIRWVADGLYTGDPVVTSLVESIIKDPEAAASEMRSLGRRIGKEVEVADAPVPHTDADKESARTKLHNDWEDEIRSGYMDEHSPEADAAVENAKYQNLEHQQHNENARAQAAKLAERGIKAVPNLKAGEPWLENGPTRGIHTVLEGDQATAEVAQHHVPEDALIQTARDTALEDFADKNPKIMELAGRIADRMGLDPFETAKVGKLVLSALDRESLYSLHDNAVLGKVIGKIREKWVKAGNSGSALTDDGIKKLLKPYLEVGADGITSMPDIGVIGSGFLDIPDIIREATIALKPEARANIVRSVVNGLADQTRKEGVAKNLVAESHRLAPADEMADMAKLNKSPQEAFHKKLVEAIVREYKVAPSEVTIGISPEAISYASSVADGVASGAHPPLALPKNIAVVDAQKAFRFVADVAGDAESSTYAPEVSKAAKKLTTYFDNFVDPSAHVIGHKAGHVHPDLAQSLKWENLANEGINDPAALWFQRQMKSNLTVRSPHSAINNFISNTAMQSSRRGDPFIFARAADTARKYEQFMGGLRAVNKVLEISPEESRIFRAIETTGIIDTDAIAQDVGLYSPGKGFGVSRAAEKVYRFLGDNSFKLEETVHNFKILDNYLRSLETGESITADVSNRTKVTITKTESGFKVESPGSKTREINVANKTQGEQLDNLVAKIASKPAQDMFFDYGDTGLFAKWLKQAPLLGVASPFYTWSYKALDIPFLKRGLVSRVTELPFSVTTNSSKVALDQLAMGAGIAARKAAFLTAARNDLLQHDNDKLGEIARRQPRELRMFWATQLADPAYMGGYDFGKFNWLKPSEKLFALLAGGGYDLLAHPNLAKDYAKQDFSGYNKAAKAQKNGGEDYEVPDGQMSKSDWGNRLGDSTARAMRFNDLMRKSDTGQLYSVKDALDLVGLAGSPLLDAINFIQDTDDQGKTASFEQAMQKFAGSIMTGAGRDILNIGTGVLQDTTGIHTPFTQRHNEKDPTIQENLIRYIVRQFTGMGYNVKNIASTTDPTKPFTYYKGMQNEWLSALDVFRMRKTAEQNLAAAEVNKDQQAIEDNERKLDVSHMLEQMVKGEIRAMYGQFMTSAEALGLKPPRWQDKDTETQDALDKIHAKTPAQITEELRILEKEAREEIRKEGPSRVPPVPDMSPAPAAPTPTGSADKPWQLQRAEALAGTITNFKLGAASEDTTDCSGFIARTLGLKAHSLTTDGIIKDALGSQKRFQVIPFSDAQPGDLVLYGSNSQRPEGHRHGHVAMIVDPEKRTLIDNTESRGGTFIHDDTVDFWTDTKNRKNYCVRYIGPAPAGTVTSDEE